MSAVATSLVTLATSKWAMKAGSKRKQLVKSKIEKSAAERAIEGILEGMSGSDLQVFSLSGYGIPDGLIGNLIEKP